MRSPVARTLALLATATTLVATPAAARADEAPAGAAALERAGVRDIVVEHRAGLARAGPARRGARHPRRPPGRPRPGRSRRPARGRGRPPRGDAADGRHGGRPR